MNQTFGFIGAGNMASAIMDSISKSDYIKPSALFLFDPDADKVSRFVQRGMNACSSAADVFAKSDFVFLCVKPQIFKSCNEQFRGLGRSDVCVVSIMAGITTATVKSVLGDCPVIRIMPNTPLLVGEGASALVHNADVSDALFDTVFRIFDSCGKAVVVSEDQISAVTAVSGSGPAYFFQFARAAVAEAAALGMDEQVALQLLCQTMCGSAKMLLESGHSADELIRMVTSPGGTTLAASLSFEQDDYEGAIKRALKACYDRAEELA